MEAVPPGGITLGFAERLTPNRPAEAVFGKIQKIPKRPITRKEKRNFLLEAITRPVKKSINFMGGVLRPREVLAFNKFIIPRLLHTARQILLHYALSLLMTSPLSSLSFHKTKNTDPSRIHLLFCNTKSNAHLLSLSCRES